MSKVQVCNCGGPHSITSADARLIRRVRKDCLENAARWSKLDESWQGAIVCTLYNAHLCLERLRELKAQGIQ